MNERIKELAEQAGFKTDRLGHLFGGDDIEKFAELIVRECCEVMESSKRLHCSNEIKRHFGVEE